MNVLGGFYRMSSVELADFLEVRSRHLGCSPLELCLKYVECKLIGCELYESSKAELLKRKFNSIIRYEK